jgi:cell division protein ZapA
MEKKTIFNEQYNLTTELPKKETEAIAEMVDKKMQQFAEKTHVVKTGRVAVWAALDFAGELYKLRKEYEKLLAAAKE